jgi:hypothetical protein
MDCIWHWLHNLGLVMEDPHPDSAHSFCSRLGVRLLHAREPAMALRKRTRRESQGHVD